MYAVFIYAEYKYSACDVLNPGVKENGAERAPKRDEARRKFAECEINASIDP